MDIILRRKQKAEAQWRYKRTAKGRRTQSRYYASAYKSISGKRWRDKNPEKNRAHQALYIAIKNGKIKRGKCSVCKKPNAFGHHNDYSKPLEVVWFCNFHHSEFHRKSAYSSS